MRQAKEITKEIAAGIVIIGAGGLVGGAIGTKTAESMVWESHHRSDASSGPYISANSLEEVRTDLINTAYTLGGVALGAVAAASYRLNFKHASQAAEKQKIY